jgi:translation initiation factor IF-1
MRGTLGVEIAIALSAIVLASPALAQQLNRYQPPRTPEGKPSFEGAWTNASITSMERPGRYKRLVIPDSEIEAVTNSHPQVVRQRNDDNLDSKTQLDGKDLQGGRGYNAFWIDPGMTFARIKGQYRTSFIIDPADGQIPYKDRDGGGRDDQDETADPRRVVRGNFDGPEARPLGERCFLTSGSAGPPMSTYLYNNNYEFAQTPDHLAIRVEMNNYTRVVRIGGKHINNNIRVLHGDSIGHWDGDALVVETTNFSPHHAKGRIGLSASAKVIERFTRAAEDQIVYEFTVEDAERYMQPWRGEMSFMKTDGRVYEYACHEGNYALPGILAGAREEERRAAEKK